MTQEPFDDLDSEYVRALVGDEGRRIERHRLFWAILPIVVLLLTVTTTILTTVL